MMKGRKMKKLIILACLLASMAWGQTYDTICVPYDTTTLFLDYRVDSPVRGPKIEILHGPTICSVRDYCNQWAAKNCAKIISANMTVEESPVVDTQRITYRYGYNVPSRNDWYCEKQYDIIDYDRLYDSTYYAQRTEDTAIYIWVHKFKTTKTYWLTVTYQDMSDALLWQPWLHILGTEEPDWIPIPPCSPDDKSLWNEAVDSLDKFREKVQKRIGEANSGD